jgi:predicted phage replisome organizer
MADIKWIKLDTGIFEDEKIKIILKMPDGKSLLVIWLKLLCLAGRINNSGVLMVNKTIPYTTEMLSAVFDEPENMMRLALDTSEKLDMVEQFNGTLLLPNWEKHQAEDRLKEIQAQTARRVAKHRDNQKLLVSANTDVTLQLRYSNADVTQQNKELRTQNKEQDVPTTEAVFDSFSQFWLSYPKKIAKESARKAWKKINLELFDTIMNALVQHKKSAQWLKDDGQYIPMPATWLNQKRWEDEITKGKLIGKKVSFQNYDQGTDEIYTGPDLLKEAREARG